MVLGSSSTAVTLTSDSVPLSSKEFLDIQATTECRFILKRIHNMIRTYSLKLNGRTKEGLSKRYNISVRCAFTEVLR